MNTIHFEKAKLTFINENILRVELKDGVEIDRKDSEAIFETRRKVMGDRDYYVLLVHGKHSSVTNDTRKMAAEPQFALYRKAFAIVVNSLAQRLIGNFYIKFDMPPSPTRLFTDEQKAIQWIKSVEADRNLNVMKNKVA